MSDRLYVDPLTNSVREERALFSFAKNLGLSFGSFFRLGVLTYARCLSESKSLPKHLEIDYQAVSSGDKDYLQRLLDERIEQDSNQSRILTAAYDIVMPKPSEQKQPDWEKIPEEQKIKVYIQQIFTRDEREYWIAELVLAKDDDKQAVLTRFCNEFIARFRDDNTRPFNKVDANEIKRVLVAWAEAEGGV